MQPPRLTGRDLPALRRELGVDVQELAAAIGFETADVDSWERSLDHLPKLASRRIRWLRADVQRSRALAKSGLPDCDWVVSWSEGNAELTDFDEIAKSFEALNEHSENCPTCQQRTEYLAQRFPPMEPYPIGGQVGLLVKASDWLDRLPSWARPAAVGAAILAAMTLPGAAIGALVQGIDDPSMIVILPFAVLMASGAGAVGGLVYSFLGRPLRKLGRVGDYPAGIVSVFGYMGAIAIVSELLFNEPIIEGSAGLLIFVGVSVFFGLLVGHWWFRELEA